MSDLDTTVTMRRANRERIRRVQAQLRDERGGAVQSVDAAIDWLFDRSDALSDLMMRIYGEGETEK